MYSFESIDLGTYRGNNYFLTGFVEPKPIEGKEYVPDVDAENYGVTVARKDQAGNNIQIVRMDTAHGQPHMDLVYLPPGSTKQRKIWLDDGYSYVRMKKYLLAHWKRFADLSISYNV